MVQKNKKTNSSLNLNKQSNNEKKRFGKFITIAVLALILIITFLKIYQYIYNSRIDIGGDSASYYILGNALANGDGYSNIQYASKSPANHFPPGYPFIISVFIKILSNKVSTLIAVNGMFLLLSLFSFFYIFYKFSKNIFLSFIISVFTLLNFYILKNSTMLMSEISFMFFSSLSIIFFIKTDLEKPFYKNIFFIALILSLCIAYYIRTTGIAIILTISALLLIKKKWSYLMMLIGSLTLLITPWIIRGQKLGGNPYIDQLFQINPYRPELGGMKFNDWISRFLENSERYITREIPSSCLNMVNINYKNPITINEWVTGLILIFLLVWGIYKLKEYRRFVCVFMVANFGILLLWPPIWNGTRFILPIIPILLFLIIYGLYEILLWIISKIRMQSNKVVSFVLPFCFLFTIPIYSPTIIILHKLKLEDYPAGFKNYFDLAIWAGQNTKNDAIICCRKPELFYLFSGRHVTNFKNTLNTEEEIDDLIKSKVTHVVLDQLGYSSTDRYLLPAIEKYPEKFKQVHSVENPISYFLEFRPEYGYWGEFKDGKRNGKGSYMWDNGIKYEGEWKNDIRDGFGTQYYPSGAKLEGIWTTGKLNGFVNIWDKNGKFVKRGFYKDDELVN